MKLFHQFKLEVESYRDYILADDPFLATLAKGQASSLLLKNYLENISYLGEHRPRHRMRAIKISEKRGFAKLAEFFRLKLVEDGGRDKAIDDALSLVQSMSREPLPRVSIDPKMESFLEFIEGTIDEDPTLYVAYSFFEEYLAFLLAPVFSAILTKKYGFPVGTLTMAAQRPASCEDFLSEWQNVYEDFIPEERFSASFMDVSKKAVRIHRQFLANCAQDPAAKTLTITIDPLAGLGAWTVDKGVFQGKQTIGGLEIFYCGMKATHPELGEAIGADASVGHPSNGAWFELLERMSILEAKKKLGYVMRDRSADEEGALTKRQVFPSEQGQEDEFRFSLSNGVAIQQSWEAAAEAACFELVERHLVLKSWYGGAAPKLVTGSDHQSMLGGLADLYDASCYTFGSAKVSCFEQRIFTTMTVLRPKAPDTPLVYAFGAGFSLDIALKKAEKEVLQRLVFLWEEEIPEKEPPFSPSNVYHQEFYLYPGSRDRFEDWVEGELVMESSDSVDRELDVVFADLTAFPSLRLHVARAISKEAIPLVFGRWRGDEIRTIPEDRLIHPIA